MAKNNLIAVHAFGEEVGRIGFDEHRNASFFQYRPDFFRGGRYATLFPFIIRKVPRVQVYTRFSGDTFRGLPPVIADSLPDSFGNVIFKTWLESKHKEFSEITVLEQLAYVGRRAMGALEYHPSKETKSSDTISINEMADVVGRVLKSKVETRGPSLDHRSLLNIFKIGSSVGGARAKILVSEEKETGTIIPGDVTTSEAYHHYLVKLDIEEDIPYSREQVEFAYYLTATAVGIDMMDSHMIDDKHFATLRYDRMHGKKIHVLTATGMTGWDFRDPRESSYENLFSLVRALNLDHQVSEQLFRRMVFNVVFANHDDHLKNHSFCYDEAQDRWQLAPAYDLTYSLNPLLNFKRTPRALSINQKRTDLELRDILTIAAAYSIKNPKGIISEVQRGIDMWMEFARNTGIPERVVQGIYKNFHPLI